MINYDDTELSLIQEQSLRLFQFNVNTGMFVDITDSVNTNQNVIIATSNGFSLFGIFYVGSIYYGFLAVGFFLTLINPRIIEGSIKI